MSATKPRRRAPERGRRIAQARKARNLSQEQLAARVGVARSTVARIETGVTDPTLDVGLAIARELGVAAETLLAGRGR